MKKAVNLVDIDKTVLMPARCCKIIIFAVIISKNKSD